MLEVVEAALGNLLSPVILFFLLGAVAAAVRSDLEIPPAVGKALALFLMVSIGFRGGLELAHGPWTGVMLAVGAVAVLLSLATPWAAYAILRRATDLSRVDAAAVAATYGSVSVVTFVAAAALLDTRGIASSGYLVAVLALMETPAILSGLILARRTGGGGISRSALREAFVSGSVLVLVGALVIGLATGERGAAAVGGVLVSPFQGILAIFLLDMGLLVVRRLREARGLPLGLVAFGLYMPLLGAAVGLLAARALGLAVGDGLLLMTLAGSASYIAVPAALRHALPEADPSRYVTLSLAVTFPFNLVVGIPIYLAAATAVLP